MLSHQLWSIQILFSSSLSRTWWKHPFESHTLEKYSSKLCFQSFVFVRSWTHLHNKHPPNIPPTVNWSSINYATISPTVFFSFLSRSARQERNLATGGVVAILPYPSAAHQHSPLLHSLHSFNFGHERFKPASKPFSGCTLLLVDYLHIYKKLSCRRETEQCFVSLNISLSHSRSFQMALFDSLGMVSYSHSIVTMALSCIISEIKRDIGRKSRFFMPNVYSTPPLGSSVVTFKPTCSSKPTAFENILF